MPKGFTIEEHEKRMRELLKPKPLEIDRSSVLQNLLDKARLKTRGKPGEVEGIV